MDDDNIDSLYQAALAEAYARAELQDQFAAAQAADDATQAEAEAYAAARCGGY